jgi:hypothetical protein
MGVVRSRYVGTTSERGLAIHRYGESGPGGAPEAQDDLQHIKAAGICLPLDRG